MNITTSNETIERTRMSLNTSTDDLFVSESPRVRRRNVIIDGENFSRHEFIAIIKAGRACGCGMCMDCETLNAARKAGF